MHNENGPFFLLLDSFSAIAIVVGEGHLFATLPDLRPPHLRGNWWGIKVQITRQKVGHIRFVRPNPFSSFHVSGGRHQAMENEKCNFLM